MALGQAEIDSCGSGSLRQTLLPPRTTPHYCAHGLCVYFFFVIP